MPETFQVKFLWWVPMRRLNNRSLSMVFGSLYRLALAHRCRSRIENQTHALRPSPLLDNRHRQDNGWEK